MEGVTSAVEAFSWLFTFLSLLGYFFVIRKLLIGQWVWAISNIGWVAYHIYKDNPSSACLFAIYLAMNIWGITVWSREEVTAAKG